jgi:anti-sigma-K factor RskA
MIARAEPPDDDLLAAEMVLGLLQGDEARAAQSRLTRERGFAALVAGWQERFVTMTDSIDPVKPPRRTRKRVLKQLFGTPYLPLSERLWVWKGLTLAAVLLAAYLGLQQIGPEQPGADSPLFATQLTGETVPLQVLAVLDPARGDVALSIIAGSAQTGRAFELWAILPDAAPVSLGLLSADARMRVALPELLRARAGQITLAISDEPAGGSPTGAPTGDVLAAAAVTEL